MPIGRLVKRCIFFGGGNLALSIPYGLTRTLHTKSISLRNELKGPNGDYTEIETDKWVTRFASFGISTIGYPTYRLLHYARYDLLHRLVLLMAPSDNNTPVFLDVWTDRFLREWGIFHGDIKNDERPDSEHVGEMVFSLESSLAKLPGSDILTGIHGGGSTD